MPHEPLMSTDPWLVDHAPGPVEPNLSAIATLFADPARVMMLTALLEGRAVPAGELARASGVTAQTASSHLSKLVEGGLIAVETQGRHRYYRLAGPHVAEAMEHLAALRPAAPPRVKALSPKARELRFARRCYDHLAGQLGVALARGLQEQGFLVAGRDKQFVVTAAGVDWFGRLGLDVHVLKATRRGLARQCLDWTERTHHLAGPLGVELLSVLCQRDWLRRSRHSRAIQITQKGHVELRERLGLDATSLRASSA